MNCLKVANKLFPSGHSIVQDGDFIAGRGN